MISQLTEKLKRKGSLFILNLISELEHVLAYTHIAPQTKSSGNDKVDITS